MSEEPQLIVSVDIADGAVKRVERRLRDVGFKVDSVMEFAGMIVGRWDDDMEQLRAIPEVAAVEISQENYPM